MLKVLSNSLLSVVYPQECSVCGAEVESSDYGVSCSSCWKSTRIFTGDETLCIKCGAFLFESGSPPVAINCQKCIDHSYDRAFSGGLYEKALSAAVLALKRSPHLSARVKTVLSTTLDRIPIKSETVIVPVPLSRRRLFERGFNQASVIGIMISRYSGNPIDDASLIRKIHTPMHRAGMDRKARAMTVKNAFEVVRPKLIETKDVLLIDDIFTSGETASNCARILKKSGAATVNVLTIARAE